MPARVYVGDAPGTVGVTELRPLIFGAAWKVLDLLVELATGKGDTIEEKARKAAADLVPAVAPFDGQPTYGCGSCVCTPQPRRCDIPLCIASSK